MEVWVQNKCWDSITEDSWIKAKSETILSFIKKITAEQISGHFGKCMKFYILQYRP